MSGQNESRISISEPEQRKIVDEDERDNPYKQERVSVASKLRIMKHTLDVAKALFVAVLSVALTILLANWYSGIETKRLNDDLAYRYFDAISKVIVTDKNENLTFGDSLNRKKFYQ